MMGPEIANNTNTTIQEKKNKELTEKSKKKHGFLS
jgi:hypothetical protein